MERRIDKAELLAVYDWDTIRQRILGALKKLGRDMPIVPEDEVGADGVRGGLRTPKTEDLKEER